MAQELAGQALLLERVAGYRVHDPQHNGDGDKDDDDDVHFV